MYSLLLAARYFSCSCLTTKIASVAAWDEAKLGIVDWHQLSDEAVHNPLQDFHDLFCQLETVVVALFQCIPLSLVEADNETAVSQRVPCLLLPDISKNCWTGCKVMTIIMFFGIWSVSTFNNVYPGLFIWDYHITQNIQTPKNLAIFVLNFKNQIVGLLFVDSSESAGWVATWSAITNCAIWSGSILFDMLYILGFFW